MIEREVLLLSLAALLLALLLRQVPRIAEAAGPRGLAFMVLGAVLPLGDLVWAWVSAPDRLAVLARPTLVETPLGSLLALGLCALLAWFARDAARALSLLRWGAVGLALFWALSLLSLPGLLPHPWAAQRVGLPLFSAGHPLLVGLLLVLLALLEGVPHLVRRGWWRRARPVFRHVAAWSLAAYLAWGFGWFAWVHDRSQQPGGPAGAELFPTNLAGTAWAAVQTQPARLVVRRIGWGDDGFGEPELVDRWDSQPLLLRFLGDGLVQRFYFRVYRHPVAHVEMRGARARLFLSEWTGAHGPQRSLMVESPQQGGGRVYQLEGFR